MSRWDRGLLTTRQAELVSGWLPDPVLIEDLSWGIVDSTVLHVRAEGTDRIVKAAGSANHHLGREIDAHDGATESLIRRGLAAALRYADRNERVMVLDHLPGALADGSESAFDPGIHRQAGAALALLHAGSTRLDSEYEQRVTDRTLAWLDGPHRIDGCTQREIRRVLTALRGGTVRTVPTHGDWQPRNWVVDQGTLRVIDFGRFAFRPASTDFCRLTAQQWRDRPDLADAFIDGYGSDPREDPLWPVEQLREAVGTAAYAYQIGDCDFEAQGHRMLSEALRALGDQPS